ncbi:hypothetical protein B0I72DRAFT_114393 [Yarrowia lipolytica]|jgi:phenylalanyl-tRNA synthetase alpha chain|uniref:Phenylalanine--tRNA ligase, mitochondrial n=2 Tax=Yarrowia lipolytica TaxID=4952 RepID=Q6CBI1_YARLI|nr:YALI0C18535p [Yarrowia lipolytica CLIB122]AOW03055.1 hypothetical protein YALI1_C25782g [Yarrowia lipolytica]KAB8283621.1 hypothetical protein BKA91DRAFT_136287 [Yarrowia lipolytica]KAE8170769.1 hypothetical protein BKA90DRAFT_115495 [Yarrowia lipolytica]KAJ8053597.1 hypothetical protein LXG23DRAFT_22294 [Yarrowia lipolytica]QNP96138.1 Phenylalanine--tRNA ligase [Yarrowia lipolytica]|eukprot:XP_501981.1 YALI0C18535p [Yarrowia lipolytica CLIB122]
MSRRLLTSFRGAIRHQSTLVDGKKHAVDEWTNITPTISSLIGRNLHLQDSHPVGIIRSIIEKRFEGMGYTAYNNFHPVVSKHENFDQLGFPEDHPGRAKTDTYYINHDTLLRTHTSAHEVHCFQHTKTPGFFVTADVYRRDTIDRTHYPAFHQMEGARTWKREDYPSEEALIEKLRADVAAIPATNLIVEDVDQVSHPENPKSPYMSDTETELVAAHLKKSIELLVGDIFERAKVAAKVAGSTDPDLEKPLKVRWVETTFPWTTPSWEIEVWWKGDWLECCGCGLVRDHVYSASGLDKHTHFGWAFGLGLERLAMILFGIPDIRLFWSLDQRFLSQFKPNEITAFKSWSKYPGTDRDVAFWLPEGAALDSIHENDIMELIRATAGDLVENVALTDTFTNPKTGLTSQCYRINFQSMERNLENQEINQMLDAFKEMLVDRYGVKLR